MGMQWVRTWWNTLAGGRWGRLPFFASHSGDAPTPPLTPSTAWPLLRERQRLLAEGTQQVWLAPGVDLGLLARTTCGLSAAHMRQLCQSAIQESIHQSAPRLTMAHFESALDYLLLDHPGELLLDEDRQRLAAHVCGHVLLAAHTPQANLQFPLAICLAPRAKMPTSAEEIADPLPGQLPDRPLWGRKQWLAWLALLLAGRAAEEFCLGDPSASGADDLLTATRLARKMVTDWGMGATGLAAIRAVDEQTQGAVYQAVEHLLEEAYALAFAQIKAQRGSFDALVAALLREESMTAAQVTQILHQAFMPQAETNS